MGGYNNFQLMGALGHGGQFGGSTPYGNGFGTIHPIYGGSGSMPVGGFGGSVHPEPIAGGGFGSMPVNGVHAVGPQPPHPGNWGGMSGVHAVGPEPYGGFGSMPGVHAVGPEPYGGMGSMPVGPTQPAPQGNWGGNGSMNFNLMRQLYGGGY